MSLPARWVEHVNGAETDAELEGLRRSVVRGRPFGDPSWAERMAKRLGLEAPLRRQGRPRKATAQGSQ